MARDDADARQVALEELTECVEGDTQAEIIDSLVTVLKQTIELAVPSERAALIKQLRETLREREGLVKPREGSVIDDLAGRGSVGAAGTVRPITAARRGQPRRSGRSA